MEVTYKFTQAGEFIRATVFTPHGSSSKTCRSTGEAQAFVNEVKAKKSLLPSRRKAMESA